ncbi:hypothetical protein BUALT_Bualt17G0049000 [Buddleja alternifolia]|uniref:Histone deacetylase domain-containing protein n=1 Tax=Buddleja alternifolia TaxID=168488 RepID=A0AAV6WCH4_9LAMI|nr:hypothetical protein BUALT_Bualt17G0049000 [Buddleja alternifolia]
MGETNNDPPKRRRVGLIYDDRMCKHHTPDEKYHPENPNRIRAVWDKLHDSGVAQRCVVLNAKKAEDNQLALVHSKTHIDLIKTISSIHIVPRIEKIASKYDSIYFNGGSSEAANLAAGSVIEAAVKVAKGELDSAFAIVRPPGHHAEEDKPMGFCLYNNVAIAASFVLNERPELGIGKILIVDWDVHHGNSTQKMFYKDPRVLFFSVHRSTMLDDFLNESIDDEICHLQITLHENGSFYPYGNDGSHIMTGEGPGAGYNINVPWENGWCGDSDYLAVWDHILIPVAKKFDPDMIIISAGFDAELQVLMNFARGKIVMALEGGYNPTWLAHSAQACVEVLLQDKSRIISVEDIPLKSTWRVIQTVRQALCAYWPLLADEVVDRRTSKIEIEIGLGHATYHTSNLQANTEVGKDHSADKEVHLKGKVISLDEQKRGRSSASQAQPLGGNSTWPEPHVPATQPRGNRVCPTNKDPVSARAAAISKASPIASSSAPSKRARSDVPAGNSGLCKDRTHIPCSSLDNQVQSCLADDNFTWDRETLQRLVTNEENLDMFKEMSVADLTDSCYTYLVNGLNSLRLLSKQGRYHEGRVTELEKNLKASEGEVARLRNENKKLSAACDKAEKNLDHEITTGEKFLKSEAGKERLEEAKKDGVDEFKMSEAFHDEILNAAENVYDQSIKACRQMAFPR